MGFCSNVPVFQLQPILLTCKICVSIIGKSVGIVKHLLLLNGAQLTQIFLFLSSIYIKILYCIETNRFQEVKKWPNGFPFLNI